MSYGSINGFDPRGLPTVNGPGKVHQTSENHGGGSPESTGGCRAHPQDPGAIDGPEGGGTDAGPSSGGGASAGPNGSAGPTGGGTVINSSSDVNRATLDVGGSKVSITGPGADKYAQSVKEWTDNNPELKKIVQAAAAANPNKQLEINLQDLGVDSKDGGTFLGLAPVGQKGQGVMEHGSIKIDTGNFSQNVFAHELTHNNGWMHGGAMDAEVKRIMAGMG
jgi:hypothetical protein